MHQRADVVGGGWGVELSQHRRARPGLLSENSGPSPLTRAWFSLMGRRPELRHGQFVLVPDRDKCPIYGLLRAG